MALDSIFSTPIIPPPPKSANPAASGSSGPGIGPDSSPGAGTSDALGSSSSPNTNATDDSSSTNGAPTSSSGSGSSAQSKPSGPRPSRSKQAQPSTTNATGSAPTRKAGTKGSSNAQSDNNLPASFLQALAQTQANATQSITTVPTVTPEATGAADKDDKATSDSDADASSSLAFISQSLAAAIAGVQQPNAAQAMASNGVAAADSDEGSTEGVSGVGGAGAGAGAGALQNLTAALAKDTAEGSKATADASSATGGSKTPAATSATPGASDPGAAVSAFQAHMSVGSHFQTNAADTNANRLESPVGSAAFNDELGDKVTWLANQGIQSASLQISPEHLGPVNVHISVQDGSASVSFNAAHADTRAALEQALPRLREMFATHGLTLSDANVSHQSPRGQSQKQSISAIGSVDGVSDDATSSTVPAVVGTRLGLLDTYA